MRYMIEIQPGKWKHTDDIQEALRLSEIFGAEIIDCETREVFDYQVYREFSEKRKPHCSEKTGQQPGKYYTDADIQNIVNDAVSNAVRQHIAAERKAERAATRKTAPTARKTRTVQAAAAPQTKPEDRGLSLVSIGIIGIMIFFVVMALTEMVQ